MLFASDTMHITKLHKVISYTPKDKEKYRPVLPTCELIFYAEGENVVHFNGKQYPTQPNTLLYLPRGVENTNYCVSVTRPVLLYNIYFDTDTPLPDHPVKLTAKTGEIRQLYEKLYRTWVAKNENYYYKSIRYTYKIFELLRKQQLAYAHPKATSRLAAAEAYLHDRYCDQNFDYGELTRRSGLSYSYFKKLFIEKYGVSPVRQVNRMRVDRACELLQTHRFTVGQIAELCGFENTYYFSRVFKNYMEVSPKNYAKSKDYDG